MGQVKNSFISLFYNLADTFQLYSVSRVIILIADILIVAMIVYYLIKLIKKTRAEQIIKGVIILLILLVISKLLNMVILNFILTNFLTYGMLLFIVIFQPELRNAFEKIGRSKIVDVFDMDENILVKHSISEIVKAVEIMSLKKIGALIVIERNTKISDVIKEGISISAKVSSELIQNIFMPRTPLHDGAVVIDRSTIVAAKCILPLASESNIETALGTRHRAAIGITELSDTVVIVVSEETGIISLAESGKLKRNLTGETLKDMLFKKLDRTKNSRVILPLKNTKKISSKD